MMYKESLRDKLKEKFFILAGPCVIEGEEITMQIASELKKIAAELDITYIFKSSFDKANRSSLDSFRGPGLKQGLEILQTIKDELDVPIVTDVHEVCQVRPAAEVADILQIPAFLCRQTDLLVEAAKSGAIVNVKKGQFLSPDEVVNILDKVKPHTSYPILITERGFSFGYQNLVVDFRSLAKFQEMDCLSVYDATHSTMSPGGAGKSSGGDYKMAKVLARAGAAVGMNGLFFETHPDPVHAKSDKATMIPLHEVRQWLEEISQYDKISRHYQFV